MDPLFLINHQTFVSAQPRQAPSGSATKLAPGNRFFALKTRANQQIEAIFPAQLEQNAHYHFISNGAFSLHNLVGHIINTTGPVHMAFSTWAISESSARALVGFVSDGSILSIQALLDTRAKSRHDSAYHLISGHCQHITMAHCHAKVSLFWNDKWQVSIIGSANYTENPRIEVGTIYTIPQVLQFHKNWLLNAIQNASNT